MIVNKNKTVQEHGEPLISRNGTSEGSHLDRVVVPSDPEVSAKATRRRFTAEYKLGILKEADSCTQPGSLGALLRREGLYSSNLNTWKGQRDRGVLSGLSPKKRGRKESGRHPLLAENEKLRKENDHLTHRLRQAELIIDVQKKISQILGIAQPQTSEEGGGD
jgi:transposase